MSRISETIYLIGTYVIAALSIAFTFENIKSIIVFITTMILLFIQIRLHLKRLKRESKLDKTIPSKKNKDISTTVKP